jgi:transcription antitermination protein NusB
LPAGRRKAREICLRVLFETEISREDARETLELALGRYRLTEDGRDYAVRLIECAAAHQEEVDDMLRRHLQKWELGRLSVLVRSLLRLAGAELLCLPESPARVILDQAILLAQRYGEADADKFVNGVLDPVAAALRREELRGGDPA